MEESVIQPYEAAGYANQEVVLHPTLGSGRGDPFGSLPVDLGPGAHSLLDHCTYHIILRAKPIAAVGTMPVDKALYETAGTCLVLEAYLAYSTDAVRLMCRFGEPTHVAGF